MTKERELLERAMESLDGGPLYMLRLKEEIRDYLTKPEVNMYAHPNLVIDECIKIIKLGMTRDGHNTPQYKQSIRHIKDLESLKLEEV